MALRRAVLGLTIGTTAGIIVAKRPEWESELTHPHRLLTTLQENSQFTRLQADPKFEQMSFDPVGPLTKTGGLSSPVVFIDKSTKGHSFTYVYAGSRTVGFPFVVHGGIIGTVLDEAFKASSNNYSKLEIKYKKPTLANQFLVVETAPATTGYTAEIRTLKGKLLVQATAK